MVGLYFVVVVGFGVVGWGVVVVCVVWIGGYFVGFGVYFVYFVCLFVGLCVCVVLGGVVGIGDWGNGGGFDWVIVFECFGLYVVVGMV